MASLRVSSSNNLQVKSAARHTSIPGARASEGQGRYGDTPTDPDPDSNTGPTRSEKQTGWMLHQNLSVWSVRACHHLSRSSRQFISKLFHPSSKMKPKAQQTLATPPPSPSNRTAPQQQKQKTIKTHQSPPSSAEHAAVPPRPSAAAAHGVAHVDGNAAASCLPKTRPAAAQFVASFASHRDPSRAIAVRLPVSINANRSSKVSAVVGRVGSGLSAGASIRVVVLWDWLACFGGGVV